MSLTGANADYRTALKPSELMTALVNLYDEVTGASLSGGKRSAMTRKPNAFVKQPNG